MITGSHQNNMGDSYIDSDKNTIWITLVDETIIPNHILDELRDEYTSNFSSVTVFYENDINEDIPANGFYDAMIGNPRIEEFMRAEIESMMANIVQDSPASDLFLDTMIKIIIEKRGSSADQFEEFVARLGDTKSARNTGCSGDKKD